jgi:hypothetical protein
MGRGLGEKTLQIGGTVSVQQSLGCHIR